MISRQQILSKQTVELIAQKLMNLQININPTNKLWLTFSQICLYCILRLKLELINSHRTLTEFY